MATPKAARIDAFRKAFLIISKLLNRERRILQADREILDFLSETSGGFEGFQDDSDLSAGAFSADFLSEK
ncbi:MAG: hypothetical protein K2K40_02080, partial [Paramuribaculum sp.]|nr:hypothetical protein [Paramuribaculum sp.]